MSPESKKLLSQFATALSNETIYGEGDHASMKRCREYSAKTEAARKALEAHIEALEGTAPAQVAQGDEGAAEFLSKRLARVAHATGYKMPEGDHQFIAGVAGTILGDIARKLETSHVTPATAFVNDGKEPDWDRYAALEKEHLGDLDKGTGIYHPDNVAAPVAPSQDA